ncbi:MAG: NADH-quinone oxidoreductase subunit C [Bacteroidota bacterium]
MEITALINFLKAQIDGLSIEQTENCTPKGITISSQHLKAVCELLHENEQFYFDMLSCITGIDNGVESGAMEVIYNLYSIPFERSLTIKVALDRKKPEVASVFDVWRTADWHEREVFDLFGIHFSGHPDLRRILLPADWNGHPLRKDYKHQDYYHGIKVEY